MVDSPRLRIGTRASPLAIAQADELRRTLAAAHAELAAPGAIELVTIQTQGDRVQDRRLAEVGGKGLFIKEIEAALADGRIDIGAHSMKDVETVLEPAFTIAAMLPREDPRDALLAHGGAATIDELPQGASVGTSSLRRQAQLLHRRPDLRVVMLRGNVNTRMRKLGEGVADATLLAICGLKRIDMTAAANAVLDPEEMLPAVGQGAIGAECRVGDTAVRDWLAAIDHGPTRLCVEAERAMLAVLDGSCRTPIAGLAELDGRGRLSLRARLALPDGSRLWEARRDGPSADAAAIGRDAGAELRAAGDPDLFV